MYILKKSNIQFLWDDKEDKIQGKCISRWKMVCRPKDKEGLGVLDLRIQNKALLMKNLHKFYDNQDIPWVNLISRAYYGNCQIPNVTSHKISLWWRDYPSYDDLYKKHASETINNGKTCLLWQDTPSGLVYKAHT
jgi:hypothetical protein